MGEAPMDEAPMNDEPIEYNAETMALLARISGDRAGMWERLRELLDPERRVDSATFPAWMNDVQENIAWIGEEGPLFEPALDLAQTFQKQAARTATSATDPEAKNDSFHKFYSEQYEWAFAREEIGRKIRDDVDRFASAMADLCRREWAAWEVGDETGAQLVRAEELQRLESSADLLVINAGIPLISAGSSMIGKLVGEFLLAVLTLESGRDYQAAAYAQK